MMRTTPCCTFWQIPPGKFASGKFPAGKLPSGKYPAGKLPPGKYTAGKFPPCAWADLQQTLDSLCCYLCCAKHHVGWPLFLMLQVNLCEISICPCCNWTVPMWGFWLAAGHHQHVHHCGILCQYPAILSGPICSNDSNLHGRCSASQSAHWFVAARLRCLRHVPGHSHLRLQAGACHWYA